MNKIDVYTTPLCTWCSATKELLRSKGLNFTEIDVSISRDRVLEMVARSGRRSVPQIFINDKHIGGFDELSRLKLGKAPIDTQDSEGGQH